MSSHGNLLSVFFLPSVSVQSSLCCPPGRPGSQIMDSVGWLGDTRVCKLEMDKSPEGWCACLLILSLSLSLSLSLIPPPPLFCRTTWIRSSKLNKFTFPLGCRGSSLLLTGGFSSFPQDEKMLSSSPPKKKKKLASL